MTGVNLDEATAIELLSEQRRRHVLECLDGRDIPMALADLAADVAALERGESSLDVPPEAIERVYLSLYHCHVPKLADAGVVEHRRDRNVVTLASENERAEKIREMARQSGIERRV